MSFSRGLRVLLAGFSILQPWIPVWGSTGEERARAMPGDEIVPRPAVAWTPGPGPA